MPFADDEHAVGHDVEVRGLVSGTRIQRETGRGYLEMRVMLPLPADDPAAADRARLAMWALDVVTRRCSPDGSGRGGRRTGGSLACGCGDG